MLSRLFKIINYPFSSSPPAAINLKKDKIVLASKKYDPKFEIADEHTEVKLPEDQYGLIQNGNINIYCFNTGAFLNSYPLNLGDKKIRWFRFNVSSDGMHLGIIAREKGGFNTHVWIINLLHDKVFYFEPEIIRSKNIYCNISVKNQTCFYLCGQGFIELYEFDYEYNQAFLQKTHIAGETIEKIFSWADNNFILTVGFDGSSIADLTLWEMTDKKELKLIYKNVFYESYTVLCNSILIYTFGKLEEYSFDTLEWTSEGISRDESVVCIENYLNQDLVTTHENSKSKKDKLIHKIASTERYRGLPDLVADTLPQFSMDLIRMVVEYLRFQSRYAPARCFPMAGTLSKLSVFHERKSITTKVEKGEVIVDGIKRTVTKTVMS